MYDLAPRQTLLVLPETTGLSALTLLTRLSETLTTLEQVGMASLHDDGVSLEDLIDRARNYPLWSGEQDGTENWAVFEQQSHHVTALHLARVWRSTHHYQEGRALFVTPKLDTEALCSLPDSWSGIVVSPELLGEIPPGWSWVPSKSVPGSVEAFLLSSDGTYGVRGPGPSVTAEEAWEHSADSREVLTRVVSVNKRISLGGRLMGWFAKSSGAQWLRVLILCGLSSSASAEIFAPVDGERLPAERAKSLTASENPGGSDAVDEAELNAKTIEKAAESEVSTADEDSETTPEPDEETETAESETDDASEAVPADTDSNQEEASVHADAIDTQETEPADAKVEDVAPSTPSQKNSNQSIEASDVADASTSSGEDASRSQDASTPAQSNEIPAGVTFPDAPKSGLWGWGLGLDVPMTGILTGNATSSTHGLGYTLGVGLGYEVVRGWVIRLASPGGDLPR